MKLLRGVNLNKFSVEIETERLIIRPLQKDDYLSWITQFGNRMPSQHKYDEGKIDMSICSEKWFVDLIEKHQQMALDDKVYVFGIFRKEDNAHLGAIDFSTILREEYQWARFGYTIHNQFWRKGYGREAVNAALQLGFEELKYHRIEAHINIDNIPSIKLAESIGMKFECIRKGFIYEFDEWADNLIYYINSK
ncbi:GNAT family N-acetyltransferase [Lottiidibacillus patelloidae]|uniref:GNAT family N-acetyltransferase n=1 Tax=Lottiidibacillus patelloidae TaxID=2670334 RepID=A0A263BW87_9BACI|nr:GNAT family N-acetyltransferase [Lottiidibacillus patelloidae]OZM57587.1 GNAT family N-acetyltransferase [Lottiidibacillus patelloidae]